MHFENNEVEKFKWFLYKYKCNNLVLKEEQGYKYGATFYLGS